MTLSDDENTRTRPEGARKRRSIFRRFCKSDDGAAAIEFAILAVPYFMVVFAIVETFIAYTGEQLVSNATENLSRKLRTGQITTIAGRTTYMDRTAFRRAFCEEVSVLIKCSAAEISNPDKLLIDLKSYTAFSAMPTALPTKTTEKFSDLDVSGFSYSPGGAGTLNMLRVYYRWQVITDIVRPYITNIRPSDGSMPSHFLIVATAVFQNEAYP